MTFVLALAEAESVPLAVMAAGFATFVVALMASAFVGNPYDLIGRGVFDRPRGDDGDRPVSDAEYDEWATAMADYCSQQDARRLAEPAGRGEGERS